MNKIEMERKWVLKMMPLEEHDILWNEEIIDIIQIYDGNVRYRQSKVHGDLINYEKIIKTRVSLGVFNEESLEITPDDWINAFYKDLPQIQKTRYVFKHKDHPDLNFEVDYYASELRLITLKVEFPDEGIMEDFKLPEILQQCVIVEVTGQSEWSNKNLAV